eukprot:7252771-Pyramimonas_sp.AAC.1
MDLAARPLAEAGHLGGVPDGRVQVLLWVRGVIRHAQATSSADLADRLHGREQEARPKVQAEVLEGGE